MNSNQIEVRINHVVEDNQSGDMPKGTANQPALENASNNMQSSGLGVTKTLGVMALRKGANYAVSNYANLSGDYLTQNQINSTIEIVGLFALGATGPVGLATAAASLGVKAADFYINRTKQNQNIEYLRQRTATWNGSR